MTLPGAGARTPGRKARGRDAGARLRRGIPLLVPDLPDRKALEPYLARIDAARRYSNFGPLVRELEADAAGRLSAMSGLRQQAVSVSNATLGLELALLALELPPASRVLVPALTFVASAAAVMRAGCVPVFCDVEPDTWLLSPRIAEAALRRVRFDAVMPVSTYGCAQEMPGWDGFQARTGIPVVVDAAGAFGNQRASARCPVVYSLHATKSLGAAEGGLVASGDLAYVERVRALANFGIDPGAPPDASAGSTGLVRQAGTNGKLSEYHAALALAALERWEDTAARRVALHQRYLARLDARCPALTRQVREPRGVYSILPVLVPRGARAADAWHELRARGVETRRWYCPPLIEQPAFAGMPCAGDMTVARDLGERLIALPFHLLLSDRELDEAVGAIAAFAQRFR